MFFQILLPSSSPNPLVMDIQLAQLTNEWSLPPYTFVRSTGDSTQNISSLPAGLYTFTVSDFSGQVFTDSVNIST